MPGLSCWVEHGVLPWPIVARLDPVQNILFIDRETYEQATDTVGKDVD